VLPIKLENSDCSTKEWAAKAQLKDFVVSVGETKSLKFDTYRLHDPMKICSKATFSIELKDPASTANLDHIIVAGDTLTIKPLKAASFNKK